MTWEDLVMNDPFHGNATNEISFIKDLMDSLNIADPNMTVQMNIFKSISTVSHISIFYDPNGSFRPVRINLDIVNREATMEALSHVYGRFEKLDIKNIVSNVRRLYEIINGKD